MPASAIRTENIDSSSSAGQSAALLCFADPAGEAICGSSASMRNLSGEACRACGSIAGGGAGGVDRRDAGLARRGAQRRESRRRCIEGVAEHRRGHRAEGRAQPEVLRQLVGEGEDELGLVRAGVADRVQAARRREEHLARLDQEALARRVVAARR